MACGMGYRLWVVGYEECGRHNGPVGGRPAGWIKRQRHERPARDRHRSHMSHLSHGACRRGKTELSVVRCRLSVTRVRGPQPICHSFIRHWSIRGLAVSWIRCAEHAFRSGTPPRSDGRKAVAASPGSGRKHPFPDPTRGCLVIGCPGMRTGAAVHSPPSAGRKPILLRMPHAVFSCPPPTPLSFGLRPALPIQAVLILR